ncbi:MAG: tetraacyldisaccharide 4'-kinase [Parvibaculum sp.]|uniref:tetraacyldisaccharide 4'-kinase n=1 Tax=Parvibaculum sp. TaxID=2024848 RepID=UPI003C75C67F
MREPRFWQHPRGGGGSVLPSLLAPAAWAWGAAGRMRRRYTVAQHAAVPIICIGNISAGGTGKTPLALTLAERLIKSGEAVHFLTRGYGGRESGPLRVDLMRDTAADVGDEPLLLAAVAPTWVSVNRAEGAAAAARAGAKLIIMDDGFQNPSLAKDISLLVVDAHAGLGNGRLIPAGPLRERVADALARTGAIVIVGHGHAADDLAARARNRALPVFRAILRAAPAPQLDGAPVLAFAGIGRPEKFYMTLRELHADLVGMVDFPDHHMFSEADAQSLLVRARDLNATLVTTEKDRVRLLHAPEGSARARLRDAVKTITIRAIIDDFAAFETLIRDAIALARRPARR